jgi:hypothetical protein
VIPHKIRGQNSLAENHMVGFQPENGFGGKSRMVSTTLVAPDHLYTYFSPFPTFGQPARTAKVVG